jgi:hypothetical protein
MCHSTGSEQCCIIDSHRMSGQGYGCLPGTHRCYDPVEDISGMIPGDFRRWHHLNQAQYIEIKILLAGYLLCSHGERMAMSYGVERRYSFLSHKRYSQSEWFVPSW